MKRNITSILASILVCLVFGFLMGCSSSPSTPPPPPPPPTIAITATSGSGQTATVGNAFTNMLVATVTSNGTAASGVTVTFTPDAGSAGQSCTPSATTVATASDGTASITCPANSAPGAYSVTAAAAGATATASFTESKHSTGEGSHRVRVLCDRAGKQPRLRTRAGLLRRCRRGGLRLKRKNPRRRTGL